MKKIEVLNRLGVALGLSEGELTITDTKDSVSNWDSIGHLNLLSELEAMFGEIVDDKSVRSFTSIRELMNILSDRNLVEE